MVRIDEEDEDDDEEDEDVNFFIGHVQHKKLKNMQWRLAWHVVGTSRENRCTVK